MKRHALLLPMYANVKKLNHPPKIDRTHKPAIAYSIQCLHFGQRSEWTHEPHKQFLLSSRFELTEMNFLRSLPDAISRREENPRLISILSPDASWRTGSSGIWTSGIFGGDLTENQPSTIKEWVTLSWHACKDSNLLVNEHGGIRPEKQNCKNNNHHMAKQSEDVILHQLKQNPRSCSTTENTTRHLLVLPHEYISSCTGKHGTLYTKPQL